MRSFQVLVLGFAVRFLSLFPVSLPQPFHRCLLYAFAFSLFLFSSAFFRPLPIRFQLLSLCFFLSVLPVSASQWLPRCSVPLSLPCFPPFSPPDHSCFLPGFSYSASCLFPFALPRFAPTAVPRVLTFCFRFRSFPFQSCFLSSADLPVLATQPSVASFPALPGFASQLLSRCCPLCFRFPGFPLPFHPVSRASLSVLSTWLSAGFLSSLPVPLPQPLPWCLPFSGFFRPLLVRPFPFRSTFFRPPTFSSDYSASALSFPFFPVFPSSGSSGACFPFRCACFHAFLPVLVLSSLFFLSPTPVSPRRRLLRLSRPAFRFSRFPFAYALGSGYSAWDAP